MDDKHLRKIPKKGPLIAVANHINFLEVPLLYTYLQPRPLTGFAKAETWENPILRPIFNLWEAIPLRRGQADMNAIRLALEALEAGQILAIAPEGTRSGDGRLQRGHPGVTIIAQRSQAPIIPVVYWGGENFWSNLSSFRRTDFHIRVGQPFYLQSEEIKVNRKIRQQMTDEIMYQLSAMLPPGYRGEYADLSAATQSYLHFTSPNGNQQK
ncbi:MAG: lysophospholipid acyltransferase family protein [Anaerolineales bacterium]